MNKRLFSTSILLAGILFLISCSGGGTKDASQKDSSQVMKSSLTSAPFGKIGDQEIVQYTLTNPNGMIVKILNYGGTVTNILVPDRTANTGDVVLGYDSLSGYLQKGNPYLGSLVGRYANRIANAKFQLDGKTYTLAANDHGNTLHGGLKGFDKVVWSGEPLPGDSSLRLTYISPEGEEGYPGELVATVIYTLTPDNTLKIDYTAKSDKPTPVNLTNHSYFNLSAGKDSTIVQHQLMLNANRFTPPNDKLIPTGALQGVKGTLLDFTTPKKIGKDLDSVKGGYDHNYVLNKTGSEMSLAAAVWDSASGRYMEVFTTQPGVQFYTGNFLDGTLTGTKNNTKYVKHSGLCLESQHFPDSPNQPAFPNSILKPGETYHEVTAYKFSIKL